PEPRRRPRSGRFPARHVLLARTSRRRVRLRQGAVVVAAVGNGQESPANPWRFADYPAALPHVIGVGAVGKQGSVPSFSNRDAAYVDIAAPGVDIVSTIPRNLVDTARPVCTGRPYSGCGPYE